MLLIYGIPKDIFTSLWIRKSRTTTRKGKFSAPLPKTEQWGIPYINKQVRLHKPPGKTALCKTLIQRVKLQIVPCAPQNVSAF
jgi:hypothetical protein